MSSAPAGVLGRLAVPGGIWREKPAREREGPEESGKAAGERRFFPSVKRKRGRALLFIVFLV